MIRQSSIAPVIMLNESLAVSDLAGSPMCINGMKLLVHARDNRGIQLTKSGAFFRKFVTWAAGDFRWPNYEAEELYRVNKVLNEWDFLPLAIMHELLVGARLIRRHKNKALLSQAGKRIVGDHGALQAELFDTFFIALDHEAYERFPIEYEDPDIRHFLGVVQNRLDGWVPLTELAGWCLPLDLITNYRFSPIKDASFYLHGRLIRPLLWMGLIEQHPGEGGRFMIENWRYRKTPLFDRFLSFKTIREGSWTIH